MTDKTSSIPITRTRKYIKLVKNHLQKDAAETTLDNLKEVHSKAYELLESTKNISLTKINSSTSKLPSPNELYLQCNF